MMIPMPATVNPWSSFTNTSGIAHHAAARIRPRTSADSEHASSGTAKPISWKSKFTSCCRPQENPYAAPIARPAPAPRRSAAARLTGTTDTAASRACATSKVTGDGKTRKNGAIRATMGWKWSPSRLMPAPLTSTTGACRPAYCLRYSVKMPRSQDVGSRRRYRNTEIGTYAANTARAISHGIRSGAMACFGGSPAAGSATPCAGPAAGSTGSTATCGTRPAGLVVAGPVVAGSVVAALVVAGPVVAGPVVAGPVVADTGLADTGPADTGLAGAALTPG